MSTFKKCILMFNESIIARELYSQNLQIEQQIKQQNFKNLNAINEENLEIIDAISSNEENKLLKINCDIQYKMYYVMFKKLFLNYSTEILNNIKIYSEHNIYYYLLKNFPQYLNQLYPAAKRYKGFHAFTDFYSYYYTLFKDNLMSLDLLNAHIVVSDLNLKNNIISNLETFSIIENSKITPLLYNKSERTYDKVTSVTQYDLDETKYNTQKNFGVKNKRIGSEFTQSYTVPPSIRHSAPKAYKLMVFLSKPLNESNFVFQSNSKQDDMILPIGNNKNIKMASIYEMFDFYLERMTLDRVLRIAREPVLELREQYNQEYKKLTNYIREHTDINFEKSFIGKPYERYFIIEYFIKNNLINENKLLSVLKPQNIEKYNQIKQYGLLNRN